MRRRPRVIPEGEICERCRLSLNPNCRVNRPLSPHGADPGLVTRDPIHCRFFRCDIGREEAERQISRASKNPSLWQERLTDLGRKKLIVVDTTTLPGQKQHTPKYGLIGGVETPEGHYWGFFAETPEGEIVFTGQVLRKMREDET
jgi:hypothetical protein